MKPIEGNKYNFKNQPERLVFIGNYGQRDATWYQFGKIENPTKVWSEVHESDLHMLEETV